MVICICDDEKIFNLNLTDILRKICPNEKLISFDNGFKLLDFIEDINNHIDILFLDLELPGLSGEETAADIRKINSNMSIIVVTKHPKRALPCYDFFPVHYLVKPITVIGIEESIKRAKRFLTFSESIIAKVDNEVRYILIQDIISIVTKGRKTNIYLETGEIIQISSPLSYYENLLKDKGFFRIKRNVLVNMSHVIMPSEEHYEHIFMSSGEKYQLSVRRTTEFARSLNKWRRIYV